MVTNGKSQNLRYTEQTTTVSFFSNLLFNVSFASFQIATLRKQIVEFQQLQLPSSSGTQQPGPSAKPSSGESKPSGVSSDRDFADEDRIQKARNEIVLS